MEIEVRRSARRRRTVSAYREDGKVIVLIPARFTKAQEREWTDRMVQRVLAEPARRRPPSDAGLMTRAAELSERYLGGRAVPSSVRWVGDMRTRWASCTPADGTIRMAERLQQMPAWVQDYVLLHELAHLLEPGHGPAFWRLLAAYPKTERARGYLDGVAAAASLNLDEL